MRISVDRDDPGYAVHRANIAARVYLDGEEIDSCFTADEEEGIVVVAARTAEGKLRIEGDRIARTVLRGKVRIWAPK